VSAGHRQSTSTKTLRSEAEKVASKSALDVPCPAENTLLALVEGQLVEGADVAGHLRGCAECQEILAELARPSLARRFGRYLARRKIGAGGMGLVYEAFDPLLCRRVALKLLRADFDGDAAHGRTELTARLLREAKALARLSHPNVVGVHDVGHADDRVFITMEFVEGTTLHRWLTMQPRTWQAILAAYIEAGRGLAAAHDAGVIHRDFKPSNVLVGVDGRVLVTDFGLARMTASDSEEVAGVAERSREVAIDEAVTHPGVLLGSPAYMSPEQLAGHHADVRSDIFSFCVSLWAALYGVRPFAGSTLGELRDSIAAQEPCPPADGGEVPLRIREVLLKGLRESPDERPQDMPTLLDDLERQRGHEGLSRAERILREADEFFRPAEKAHAVPALAVSLLEGAFGKRLRPQPRNDRPDLPDLPAIEVTGRRMNRFVELMGPHESIMTHLLARAGLAPDADRTTRFDPTGWYPYVLALDFARSEPFGPEMAYRIGYTYAVAVLETEGVRPDRALTIDTLLDVEVAMNRGLRLRGRTLERQGARDGSAGGCIYEERAPGCIEVQSSTASRCASARGCLAGVASHFAKDVEVEHCEGPCRDHGATACRYLLKFRP
jgi:tRNA A-37 threonylcarbamoyl transferase component Bud32